MAYFFSSIVEPKEFPPNHSFQAVDGTVHRFTDSVLDGSVYQLLPDGRRVHVCFLQKIDAFAVDKTAVKVQYSDGCLTFEEYYDGPLRREWSQNFVMEDQPWMRFSVNHYYVDDTIENLRAPRCWLDCAGRYYPVWVEREKQTGSSRMTVYDPAGEVRNDLMIHRPLAVITGVAGASNRKEFRIRMEKLESNLLCMAICALTVIL